MTRYTAPPGFGRTIAPRRSGRSRWLTSLLITTAVAANVASCRHFDLNDAVAAAGNSNAGNSNAGNSNAGNSNAGNASAGLGGNNAAPSAGGQPTPAGSGGGGEQTGGAGYGGAGAANLAGTAGDGETSGAAGTENAVFPSALSAVVLWLEGSDASFESNESRVSKWKDSSKHGNDATEPDTALQPHLVTNALNGLPGVTFDGTPSNLVVSDHASLQFGIEPFTVAFVGEWRNSPTPKYTLSGSTITYTYAGYGFILTKALATEPYDGIAISANIASPFGTVDAQRRLGLQLEIGTAAVPSKANDLNDGQFRLYVVRRSAPGLIEQRINGTEQNSADIPPNLDASAPGRSISLGGNMYNPFDGTLAELVMVKGALSESDLHGLELYLMTKFGLQ